MKVLGYVRASSAVGSVCAKYGLFLLYTLLLLYDCICARWLWSIMNEHATANINMKGCTLMIDCRGTRAKEEKEEKKEREKRKRGKRRKKKCPRKDLNLRSSACKASFANHCATAHVLIGANRW